MRRDEMSWNELGSRVCEARRAAGLNQTQLGEPLGLDRSAISRIESGSRSVDSLELSTIARTLDRPIEWFFRPRPPTVVSRKTALDRETSTVGDLRLEDLVADVELLVELGVLDPFHDKRPRRRGRLRSPADSERLARMAREAAELPEGPVFEPIDAAERLGLLVFVLDLDNPGFDGSYVALPGCGVALVDGTAPSGKRRFTVAHELGHHFLEDEYDTFVDAPASKSRREKLIDAFAVHFLLPRAPVTSRFRAAVEAGETVRRAALRLGWEYQVSWTALCAHLKNLDLIDEKRRRRLVSEIPGKAEFLELGLRLPREQPAPLLPAGFVKAVIAAWRDRLISAERAVEMLRGTVEPGDLPRLEPFDSEDLLRETRTLT
ncbi:MAG: XRE family transcriptional regulator [Polyangia bacterium]